MIFPSLFKAVRSAARSFQYWLFGYKLLVEPEISDIRMAHCERCDEITEDRQCLLCTCFVDAKVQLAAESCPKSLWPCVKQRKSLH